MRARKMCRLQTCQIGSLNPRWKSVRRKLLSPDSLGSRGSGGFDFPAMRIPNLRNPWIKNVATACASHAFLRARCRDISAALTLLARIAHPREVNSRVWMFNATTRAECDQGITRTLARKQRLRELRFAACSFVLLVSPSALKTRRVPSSQEFRSRVNNDKGERNARWKNEEWKRSCHFGKALSFTLDWEIRAEICNLY